MRGLYDSSMAGSANSWRRLRTGAIGLIAAWWLTAFGVGISEGSYALSVTVAAWGISVVVALSIVTAPHLLGLIVFRAATGRAVSRYDLLIPIIGPVVGVFPGSFLIRAAILGDRTNSDLGVFNLAAVIVVFLVVLGALILSVGHRDAEGRPLIRVDVFYVALIAECVTNIALPSWFLSW